MRQLAVATAVNLAAIAAATFILHEPQSRDHIIEQVRREQQQLVHHVERVEQTLTAALNARSPESVTESQAATRAPPSGATGADRTTTVARLTPEQQATHDELLRSGNVLADRMIASGTVVESDFRNLAAATRGLSAAERVQIIARLHAALNANQVRLDDSKGLP